MNKKILIVEDEKDVANLLERTLTSEGYDCISANDGEKGLALAISEHPDLIFLDIIMPKKDGLSMLKDLRENKWGKHAKVIVLTNLSYIDDGKDFEKLKKDSVLVKSEYTLKEVIKKANKVLA